MLNELLLSTYWCWLTYLVCDGCTKLKVLPCPTTCAHSTCYAGRGLYSLPATLLALPITDVEAVLAFWTAFSQGLSLPFSDLDTNDTDAIWESNYKSELAVVSLTLNYSNLGWIEFKSLLKPTLWCSALHRPTLPALYTPYFLVWPCIAWLWIEVMVNGLILSYSATYCAACME